MVLTLPYNGSYRARPNDTALLQVQISVVRPTTPDSYFTQNTQVLEFAMSQSCTTFSTVLLNIVDTITDSIRDHGHQTRIVYQVMNNRCCTSLQAVLQVLGCCVYVCGCHNMGRESSCSLHVVVAYILFKAADDHWPNDLDVSVSTHPMMQESQTIAAPPYERRLTHRP